MRKIVVLESMETKLQESTQDYVEWLSRTTESNLDLDRIVEAGKSGASALDVAFQSFTSMAWAINMAKSLEKALDEFQNSKSGGDKLKVLTVSLGLIYALSSGLMSVRDVVRKMITSKP